MCERKGLSTGMASKIENGNTSPSLATLRSLFTAFQYSLRHPAVWNVEYEKTNLDLMTSGIPHPLWDDLVETGVVGKI
jgi:transcriptional regulator with XRE-family HTH domain